MSKVDRDLYGALHGTAVRYAAEQRDLTASIAELRKMADGRDDVLAEAAGLTAGSWYASPATHVGHELIAAGMLILAAGGRGAHLTTSSLSAGHGSGTSAEQQPGTENAEHQNRSVWRLMQKNSVAAALRDLASCMVSRQDYDVSTR